VTQQRRGNAIAMTPGERDHFVAEERTCRLAAVDYRGKPHVTPLWFGDTIAVSVHAAEPVVGDADHHLRRLDAEL
jgi:nitroimidazol reductase NimA-like FMN-containing flavoprotein (pyridoxamine 5'-phosphate oxidase superfamily)